MIPRGYGRIVDIASIAGLRGNSPDAMSTIAYNASKEGRREFHSGAGGRVGTARDYRQCDRPGLFPFEHDARVAQQVGGADSVAAEVSLRRIGDSEDLKGAVALFASDAGKHITGQILAVDGGATAVL